MSVTTATSRLSSIGDALRALRAGRPVIVVDAEDRENEGDLIMPADTLTPEWMGFVVRFTSGVVCVPLPRERAEALGLDPMVETNQDPKGTAYTVSCDAVDGVSTGISAADRTTTVRTLADPGASAGDLSRPGHVFPLIARDGGVLERPGHTEAGVDLAQLAGFAPVSVIAELVHDTGEMMRLDALLAFGRLHGLEVISIENLIAFRLASQAASSGGYEDVKCSELVTLPTPYGDFLVRSWRVGDEEHLSLTAPSPTVSGPTVSGPTSGNESPLVRVHSECLTGDVLGSGRCDCGEQLQQSLERIAAEGGTLIYLRGQEGRGIGLFNKIRAYALQDRGRDTVDANTDLGLPVDARDYSAAAAILHTLDLDRVRLLTNNPAKVSALENLGVRVVARVDLQVPAGPHNTGYLRTKRVRMHHALHPQHLRTPQRFPSPQSVATPQNLASSQSLDTPHGPATPQSLISERTA
ncbi:3,4-dihydroxy-2-butanone-4-phosphate synthase [Galactobacter sp.]|uniref:3,4-dihydroxy-2-butanone-4-phosphate synthase n=1 Tax=Galactobacter sp. TaxID=2676125 RepID=UPI0025BC7CD8|nr:3,4-dihydroxy-2-butanone-4-phosphate synthase [Galactobacter sp.]